MAELSEETMEFAEAFELRMLERIGQMRNEYFAFDLDIPEQEAKARIQRRRIGAMVECKGILQNMMNEEEKQSDG